MNHKISQYRVVLAPRREGQDPQAPPGPHMNALSVRASFFCSEVCFEVVPPCAALSEVTSGPLCAHFTCFRSQEHLLIPASARISPSLEPFLRAVLARMDRTRLDSRHIDAEVVRGESPAAPSPCRCAAPERGPVPLPHADGSFSAFRGQADEASDLHTLSEQRLSSSSLPTRPATRWRLERSFRRSWL